MSHEAFEKLDNRVQERQKFPDNAKVKTVDYFGGKKTNLLTSVCIYWLKSEGYFAQRNSTTGTPRKMPDGSVKWTPAPGMRGSGDIYAIVAGGRSLWIEIKYGQDKMRPDQIKFRDSVIKQGALYCEVRTFDNLLKFLNTASASGEISTISTQVEQYLD
jgi:hypothetical protein